MKSFVAIFVLVAAAGSSAQTTSLSPSGRKCLDDSGVAKEQYTQKGVYEHIVKFKNICDSSIALRVCYAGTSNCTSPTVPARGSTSTLLGIKKGQPSFDYDFTER